MSKIEGHIELGTQVAASAPNNSIFRDVADNLIKTKDNSGTVAEVGGGGGGGLVYRSVFESTSTADTSKWLSQTTDDTESNGLYTQGANKDIDPSTSFTGYESFLRRIKVVGISHVSQTATELRIWGAYNKASLDSFAIVSVDWTDPHAGTVNAITTHYISNSISLGTNGFLDIDMADFNSTLIPAGRQILFLYGVSTISSDVLNGAVHFETMPN